VAESKRESTEVETGGRIGRVLEQVSRRSRTADDAGGAAGSVDTSADLQDQLTLGQLTLLQLPLWLCLLGTPVLAQRWGLDFGRQVALKMRPRDAGIGLLVGVVSQVLLVPLLYIPILRIWEDLDVGAEAEELVDMAVSSSDRILLVVMTVLIAPVAEEVFYRGLVQRALQDGFGKVLAVAITSLLFAGTHFQLVQFPALVLVGVVFGILAVVTGRLGPAIWAHAGFNAVTVIVLLL